MVTYTSEVVAKQRGPVKRCGNHISEDKQAGNNEFTIVTIIIIIVLLGQLTNIEHFLQCRMDDAVYFMVAENYCVSVPFDKLVGMSYLVQEHLLICCLLYTEGVCLFSFACYNSCLEYKDKSCQKAKLVKPGLRALFTLLDANDYVLGEDTVDIRVCACPLRDAPKNSSCHSKSRFDNVACSNKGGSVSLRSSNLIKQQLRVSGIYW